MHKSHYQPRRSQHLYLAEQIRLKVFNDSMDRIIVHHVLEDSPNRLYVQIERWSETPFGFTNVTFERVEL